MRELQPAKTTAAEERVKIIVGDSRKILTHFQDQTFQTCITSPPYWGLRDYGIEGQIGAEYTLENYLNDLVSIFHEVKRVLRNDGTLWLNIGDSYTSGNRGWRDADKKNPARGMSYRPPNPKGLKNKELVGVPWRLALALQADGWYLRSDIIWYKPNCQPESVKDRPTRSHEYIFLFAKSEEYYYDSESVREPAGYAGRSRSRRTLWSINTEASREAHFAMFPPSLVKLCILAGSPEDGLILDPFFGAGTVGAVAIETSRNCIGIELNDEYAEIARKRIRAIQPTKALWPREYF